MINNIHLPIYTSKRVGQLLSFCADYEIFTDLLPIANTLILSQNQIVLFGGELRDKSSSVFGGWTVSKINEIQVDACCLDIDGLSNLSGPSCSSSFDAYVDKAIIAHLDKNIC